MVIIRLWRTWRVTHFFKSAFKYSSLSNICDLYVSRCMTLNLCSTHKPIIVAYEVLQMLLRLKRGWLRGDWKPKTEAKLSTSDPFRPLKIKEGVGRIYKSILPNSYTLGGAPRRSAVWKITCLVVENITRNSSGDEIANVNFLCDDVVHALKMQ